MNKTNNLYTKQHENLNINNPLEEYPFPNFKRDSYLSLNGVWKHKVTKDPNDLTSINEDIVVPYPIESINSNVQKRIKKGEYIIYKKRFKLVPKFIKKHTFLHFLGVDQKFRVILNGSNLGLFIPLGLPSKIDISKCVKEKNELIIIVQDDLDPRYPLGKQSNNPKGIFYTPFSGIYYPVFIESVNEDYIKNVKINTTLDSINLNIESSAKEFEITIIDNEKEVLKTKTKFKNLTLKIPNPILWDIDNPHLYDIEVKTNTDKISSYFGLREIKMQNGYIYLNNKRVFLNGVLDQGYFPEGIITPSTYESYKVDILTMKELGFNTLRKHIKIELPYFYYLCDKYGMLVVQDFVNNGKYNFFKDTALPTIGLQKRNDKAFNKNETQRSNFIKCGENLISYLNNHPCIVAYTIFNEGWGQFDSNNVYKHFKVLYPALIFDTASGWYQGGKTDFESYHWYFKNIDKLKEKTNPVFLSEFGALCYKVESHAFGNRRVFGYRYLPSISDVENEFIKLYEEKIIPYKDKLIGTIYTQLSDVEEEDNGILSYDRKILKLDKEKIKKVLKKLND